MSTDQRNPIQLPNLGASPLVDPTNTFCGVTTDANGNAILPTAGGAIYGVVYGYSTDNSAVSVQTPGNGKIKAQYGATVTMQGAGTPLKVNASGQFVPANATDVAAGAAVALATEGGSSGEIHPIILIGGASPQASVSGSDTLSASGAASTFTQTTLLSTSGTFAYTLANGQFVGQRKTFREITGSGTGTLTLATVNGSTPAVWVFHAANQEVEFEWMATGWQVVRKIRAGALTVVVGTTVLTGYLLTETFNLSVTGTVSSTGTMAIPAPNLAGEYIRAICTVAASIPSGSIAVAGFTKALVAATTLGGINATTCTASWLSNGASWDNEQLTTATYS